MSNQWYILRDGNIVGPYSPTEIREQAKLGNIQPTTRMCRDLKGAWVKAAKVHGLDFPVQNVSEPAQWSNANEAALPPPPPLPLAHIQYPPPPPIPTAKPNYPPPPPLPVIHAAHGDSETKKTKEQLPNIQKSGSEKSELENTDTRPWYLKFLAFLIPATIGWLLFRGGCQTLVKEYKKRNPPPKVQQVQAVPAAIPIVRSVGEFAGTQDEQH